MTVIGGGAGAIISDEVSNYQFGNLTKRHYIKVSWQVTGIRKDVSVQADRLLVEVDKPDHERGTYIDPTAFGMGEEFGIYNQNHLPRDGQRKRDISRNALTEQSRRGRSER